MARAHCDLEIKANYVREACRLMRSSNINVVKTDVEFEDNIQNDINKEMAGQRLKEGQTSTIVNLVR